jgi:hypothetical protein
LPDPSVTTERVALVATLRIVTVAPGTTASWLSLTVPWMVPVVDWAASGAWLANMASTQHDKTRRKVLSMTLLQS